MKSYLRFLSRNKLYTCIEAFGLAFALGFIILLVSYAKTEFSVGKNIPNADKIYVLGTGDMFGVTLDAPVVFFPLFPEIDSWTRLVNGWNGEDVVIGDDYYSANSCYLDSNFFQMFDYELRGCDQRQVLTNELDVIVSESFARKAFGNEDAIGKQLRIGDEFFTICGVIEDFGRKDLFMERDLFFSIKRAYNLFQPMDQFGNTLTFLTLKPEADPEDVAAKLLDKYMEYWPRFYARDNTTGASLWGSTLTSFDKVYFSKLNSYSLMKKGNETLVEVLLIVALILLISACFNYVNLTVALTGKRAKEMTMRRVLGEQNHGVLFRYFSEAFLFALGCFLLGYVVAWLFKPLFEEWLSTSIPLIPDMQMIAFSVVALLLLSLVSSLLPALLVLKFKPLDVVKGSFRFHNKMFFGKVFIVMQNIISMVLIAVAMTMTLQMHHLLTLPLGYQPEGLIAVSSSEIGYTYDRQDILRQRLLTLPQVEAVGKACNLPYRTSFNGILDAEGNRSWISFSSMDTTAFRLLGFKVVEQFADPTDSLCWVDCETQCRYDVSATHPSIDINKTEQTGTSFMRPRYKVCGVVENYRSGMGNYIPRFEDMHNVIQLLGPTDYSWAQVVKIKGDRGEALAAVKKTCNEVTKQLEGYPKELPCSYYDDSMRDALIQERHTMQLVLCFMFLSILISALGLFAMSFNYSEQHSKEIALCKIMGATVKESVWKLSRRFILLSIVAIVLAMPLCVKAMKYYLQDFYDQIDFPWFVILFSAFITLFVVVLSILGQAIRVANRNPIEGIKTE